MGPVIKTLKAYVELLEKGGYISEMNIPSEMLDKEVQYITYNSKTVVKDSIFIAKGLHFLPEYLGEAFEKGAFMYISEKKFDETKPYIIINNLRDVLSALGSLYYDEIWNEKLTMIGVGGTKGKSTTSMFVKHTLDVYCEAMGMKGSGYCSGIYNYDGKTQAVARKITTPETLELHENLANCVYNGLKYHVMETSSQSLKYKRVSALKYAACSFITFGKDHISDREHPNEEDYFVSKLKIFALSDTACVNLELPEQYLPRVLEAARRDSKRVFTFGRVEGADFYGYDVKSTPTKLTFKLKYDGKVEDIEVAIGGYYNSVNALCAIALLTAVGIPMEWIKKGLATVKVPGRMEVQTFKNKDVDGIVDAAHNTLSGISFFENLKQLYPDRKIFLVFGAAGGKAKNRRKDLGEIADKYADKIILTEHDPADERAEDICAQIAEFIRPEKLIATVLNRKQAILTGCDMVQDGEVLVIMGNGPDAYQKRGTTLFPEMTDAEIIKEYIDSHAE